MPNPEKILIENVDVDGGLIPIYFDMETKTFKAEVANQKYDSSSIDVVRTNLINADKGIQYAKLKWTKVLRIDHDNEDNASVEWDYSIAWMAVHFTVHTKKQWGVNIGTTVYELLVTNHDPAKGYVPYVASIASKADVHFELTLPHKTTFTEYTDYETNKHLIPLLDKIRDVAYDLNHIHSLDEAQELSKKYNIE